MLKARIVVDLPSAETRRAMGPIERVRSLFGATIDLRSGKEELTVGAFSLVEGIVEAFTHAELTNAISFIVDKKVVYLDSHETPDDLALIAKAAEEKGSFDRKFQEMHLVLSHNEAGLHALIDLKVRSQVALGDAEMSIEVAGRIEELRIKQGETAAAYAERIRTFSSKDSTVERYRAQLDGLAQKMADALRRTLVGATVSVEPAVVQVVQPSAREIARFRNLKFGRQVERPGYRSVPTHHRSGAYAEPFHYYYYDPYYGFMNWVLLDSMLHHHHWHTPSVNVVSPYGATVATGESLSGAHEWGGSDTVSFDESGNLHVASTAGGDLGSADVGDWGSGDPGGGGWSDAGGDGGDSGGGSSCGSSCGGSSCGSSCGGGCGGGD